MNRRRPCSLSLSNQIRPDGPPGAAICNIAGKLSRMSSSSVQYSTSSPTAEVQVPRRDKSLSTAWRSNTHNLATSFAVFATIISFELEYCFRGTIFFFFSLFLSFLASNIVDSSLGDFEALPFRPKSIL